MKIEKNIPIPKSSKSGPFEKLESGDSIMFYTEKEYKACRSSLTPWLARNMPKLKIVGRKVDNGYRLWVIDK